jgi:hypothetical protein
VSKAYLLSSGKELPLTRENGVYTARLDVLNDYDVVVFE